MGKEKGKQSAGPKGQGAPLKGGKLGAAHILVNKLSEAQKICDDITAGVDFAQLARQYSQCSSKNKGGNLGEFGKEKMVPEFWNACTKLNIGQVSEPVKSQFGYHVIKRTR